MYESAWLGSSNTVCKTACGLDLVQGLQYPEPLPKELSSGLDERSSLVVRVLCFFQREPGTLLIDSRSTRITGQGVNLFHPLQNEDEVQLLHISWFCL